jgi:hypothetical protein
LVFGVFSASNNYFHICPIYRLGFRKTDKNMKPTVKNQKQKSTTHCQRSKQQQQPHQQPTGSIPAT